jgi:hypothetical protein
MTTKPKARKFRIRKTGGASTTGPDADGSATDATSDGRMASRMLRDRPARADKAATFAATEDGFPNARFRDRPP